MTELDLMTRVEVAELLRVSRPTLSRWASTGEGPPVIWLAPSMPRYNRADVVAWVRANRGAA